MWGLGDGSVRPGWPLSAFPPSTALLCSRAATGAAKAALSSSAALERRRRLSKYSWCFDDKTFDRNMNDTNTLISSLRSFNSNYESRGVNMGSSYSNAPEGGEAVIRDKPQSISACAAHEPGGGGLGEGSAANNSPYSSGRHKTNRTLYISKQNIFKDR